MEDQGTARTENCSRKLEFDENLSYRHLNSVRNQNFGSKSHSGWLFFDFWQDFGPHKKIMNISSFYFGPGSPKNRFLRFFWKFYEKNPGYGNLEWDDDSGNLEWDDDSVWTKHSLSEASTLSKYLEQVPWASSLSEDPDGFPEGTQPPVPPECTKKKLSYVALNGAT